MYFFSQPDADKQIPPVIHLNCPQIREQIRNCFKQEFEKQMLRQWYKLMDRLCNPRLGHLLQLVAIPKSKLQGLSSPLPSPLHDPQPHSSDSPCGGLLGSNWAVWLELRFPETPTPCISERTRTGRKPQKIWKHTKLPPNKEIPTKKKKKEHS